MKNMKHVVKPIKLFIINQEQLDSKSFKFYLAQATLLNGRGTAPFRGDLPEPKSAPSCRRYARRRHCHCRCSRRYCQIASLPAWSLMLK